jgi:hypothetical protein
MNETLWKQDVTALYAAAARRSSGSTTEYAGMEDRSLGDAQVGMP